MEENIKIIKLPDILNPNKIAEDKILEKYGTCPFCGEKREYDHRNGLNSPGVSRYSIDWHGKYNERDGGIFACVRFWEKSRRWKYIKFTCYTCGAKWESPTYPIDIGEYE